MDYLTTDTELISVADAIRAKGSTSAALVYPAGFVSAIEAIDIPTIQPSKSATPTETAQIITPDTGYDGIAQVNVGAISSTYVGSGIDRKSSTDLTVSGATVIAPAGYYSSAASKYLNGVTLEKPSSGSRIFSVTVPNGSTTATFVFNVDSSGNVTITES